MITLTRITRIMSSSGRANTSARIANPAAAWRIRWRRTSSSPFQKPGWVNGHRSSACCPAIVIRDSYRFAVLTLTNHIVAITAATANAAKRIRESGAHS
jgi:hypothetical protein